MARGATDASAVLRNVGTTTTAKNTIEPSHTAAASTWSHTETK